MNVNVNANGTITKIPQLPTDYLPPDEEAFFARATYMVVGSLSVLLWDVIVNLKHDIRLAIKQRMNITFVVYLISRISSLCLAFMEAFSVTVPIPKCTQFVDAQLTCFTIVLSSTMLLSYFRVCAVWQMKKCVVITFGVFYLIGIAGLSTTFVGISGTLIPNSLYCTTVVTRDLAGVAIITPALHHLATLIAITYGICRSTSSEIKNYKFLQTNYRRYIQGKSLPAFSKNMLQVSQICYLVATLSGIGQGIWFYAYKSIPPYRFAISPVYTVIINVMFSWVFRQARLGGVSSQNMRIIPQGINLHQSSNLPRSTPMWKDVDLKREISEHSVDDVEANDTLNGVDHHPVAINITEVVEHIH